MKLKEIYILVKYTWLPTNVWDEFFAWWWIRRWTWRFALNLGNRQQQITWIFVPNFKNLKNLEWTCCFFQCWTSSFKENDKITSTPQTSGHSFEEISVEVKTRGVVQNFRWNQTIKSTAVTPRGQWTPDQNYIVESYLLSSSSIRNWQLKNGPQFGFLLLLSDFLDCAVQFRQILLTVLVYSSGEKKIGWMKEACCNMCAQVHVSSV